MQLFELDAKDDTIVSGVSKGGFVLVEKVTEPLDAIRKACRSCIRDQTKIPKILQLLRREGKYCCSSAT